MRVIRLQDVSGGGVLAGANAGAKALAKLVTLIPPSGEVAAPLMLDFTGVQLATASYLREAILPFKAFARTARTSWYPVIANASAETLEELEIVCSARADPILTCSMCGSGSVENVRLCGSLDPKQRDAYQFVIENGSATAKALMETRATAAEMGISPTAWNNRLTSLVDKGLVAESFEGRQKVYTPILRCGHGN